MDKDEDLRILRITMESIRRSLYRKMKIKKLLKLFR